MNILVGVIIPEVIKQILLLRPGIKLFPGDEGKVEYQGYIPRQFVIGYDK